MKFPSLFKSTGPQRFGITPRYYDPVKEEIEARTSRIKKELESEGLLSGEDGHNPQGLGAGIRGSFSTYRGIKPREKSLFNYSTMIRSILFFAMILTVFGYIYIGPEALNYLLYAVLIAGGIYFFIRIKNKSKR